MTETLYKLFLTDPLKAALFGAILLVAWFIKNDHKRRAEQFTAFENKMRDWESKIDVHITTSSMVMQKHSENMGNATKAINGDMLSTKEKLFELRTTIHEEIDALKVVYAQMQTQLELALQTVEKAIDELKGKFLTINETKKAVTMFQSKIIHLEENTGKTSIRVSKFEERLGHIEKAQQKFNTAAFKEKEIKKTKKEN